MKRAIYFTILTTVILACFSTHGFGSEPDSVPNLEIIGTGIFKNAESYTEAIKIKPGELGAYIMRDTGKLINYFGYDHSDSTGLIETYGRYSKNTMLSHVPGYPELGLIAVYGNTDSVAASISADVDSTGILTINGSNGNRNFSASRSLSGPQHGFAGVFNPLDVNVGALWSNTNGGVFFLGNNAGEPRVQAAVDSSDVGIFMTYGSNGQLNTAMGSSQSSVNRGWLGIYDENGDVQASMFIDGSGDGIISGDVKSFVMEHPDDESLEIWYACIEGPEVGAYDRGTATLTNGRAFIPYSEHFGIVINPTTVTISVTPHISQTFGLAVVQKTDKGFYVEEAMDGAGNFTFDWEVKGVRKGYEDFRVIRPRDEADYQPDRKLQEGRRDGEPRSVIR